MTSPAVPTPAEPVAARWRVPGRIEVLGKHTDYAGGDVLVCAVDRGVDAVAIPASGDATVATSDGFPEPVSLRPGVDPGLPPGHWARYVQTVVDRLARNFGPLAGTRLAVTSDLPMASGMSSSSALLCAVALALADRHGFRDTAAWREAIGDNRLRLASYLASVENGRSFGPLAGLAGVGTLGGSEDHTAMLCGTPGELGWFGFAPVALRRRVPWPAGWSFVVAVSGVAAEKTGAAQADYNRASQATAEALRRWNAATGRGDRTLADAVRSAPDAPARLTELLADDRYLGRRVAQFVEESEVLVPAAADAVAAGDLSRLGAVAAASQRLAQTHLGNQVPQTSGLVAAALALGAPAASAFGAGFGGSVWAAVPTADADAFAVDWLNRYTAEFPDQATAASTLVTVPSPAAGPDGRAESAEMNKHYGAAGSWSPSGHATARS